MKDDPWDCEQLTWAEARARAAARRTQTQEASA